MPEAPEETMPEEAPLDVPVKLKVVTQEGCPPCEEILAMLKDSIDSGDVELIPIESKAGQEFAEQHGVSGTPTVFLDSEGKLSACRVLKDEAGDMMIECDRPDEDASG